MKIKNTILHLWPMKIHHTLIIELKFLIGINMMSIAYKFTNCWQQQLASGVSRPELKTHIVLLTKVTDHLQKTMFVAPHQILEVRK